MTDPAYFFSGSLFSTDYLSEAVRTEPAYQSVDTVSLAKHLQELITAVPDNANEAHTEDHLIWPVLQALGWDQWLRQQNLSATGRQDVPDGILFSDAASFGAANVRTSEKDRYEHGVAIVESKRLNRPLDRSVGREEATAPSTQMLRYLRRIDI